MECEICGKEIAHPVHSGEFKGVCSKCFNTKYWQLIVAEKERHLVADGVCYSIGDEDVDTREKGHDGRRFYYKDLNYKDLNTGEVHTTTNLWLQGKIPDEFRDQLPDTVRFVHL